MDGLFQLASLLPFFISAWVVAGLEIRDITLFSVFFSVLVLGTIAQSVEQKKAILPFPEQLHSFIALGLGGLIFYAYSETKSLEVLALLGCSGVLRYILARVPIRNGLSLALVSVATVLSSSLAAPLGAYLARRELSMPYAIFGIVPSLLLCAALVAKFTPALEAAGWTRQRSVTKRDGTVIERPGPLSVCLSSLLFGAPVIAPILAFFHYLPLSFTLTVLSVIRGPAIAEAYLGAKRPDAKIFQQVVVTAMAAEFLMFAAAYM